MRRTNRPKSRSAAAHWCKQSRIVDGISGAVARHLVAGAIARINGQRFMIDFAKVNELLMAPRSLARNNFRCQFHQPSIQARNIGPSSRFDDRSRKIVWRNLRVEAQGTNARRERAESVPSSVYAKTRGGARVFHYYSALQKA